MKTQLLILLFIFLGCDFAIAQISFPLNDAVWKESHLTIAGPIEKYFGVCGDTTIGNVNYNKVLDLKIDSVFNVTGGIYNGAIRSVGEVVYYQPHINFPEYLLYDFRLETGDSIDLFPLYFSNPITRYVDSTTVSMLAGEMRKVIYFRPGFVGAEVEYWVEGIGSNYGLLGRAFDLVPDAGFNLLCFGHEDEYFSLSLIECFLPELSGCSTINSTSQEIDVDFSVYPNPASNKIFLKSGNNALKEVRVNLFRADGRKVKEYFYNNTNTIELEVSKEKPGMYYLEVWNSKTNRRIGFSKIIIQ